MKNNIKISALLVVFLVWIVLSFTVAKTYLTVYGSPDEIRPSEKVPITIKTGMTLNQIVDLLHDRSLLQNRNDFIFAADFLDLETEIQAGQYLLTRSLSNYELLKQLRNAGTAAKFVTIPEGFTSRQIAG
ncbi:MAG: endolytic transglycosylase MltG, partial [bacterium]